jgi:hypothetical protein
VQVPEKKLKMVMADKELYKVCGVEVKRQIWQDNQALFGDEVSPLLKQYIVEKEGALFSNELSVLHNFFSPSPKARRQGEVGTSASDATMKPLRCTLGLDGFSFIPDREFMCHS